MTVILNIVKSSAIKLSSHLLPSWPEVKGTEGISLRGLVFSVHGSTCMCFSIWSVADVVWPAWSLQQVCLLRQGGIMQGIVDVLAGALLEIEVPATGLRSVWWGNSPPAEQSNPTGLITSCSAGFARKQRAELPRMVLQKGAVTAVTRGTLYARKHVRVGQEKAWGRVCGCLCLECLTDCQRQGGVCLFWWAETLIKRSVYLQMCRMPLHGCLPECIVPLDLEYVSLVRICIIWT